MTDHESPQILALKERYKSSLVDKMQSLSDYLIAIESDDATLDQVAELRGFLHKLAGSSGMYDYDDISVASRKAMLAADKVENVAHIDELKVAVGKVANLLQTYC